MQRFWAHVSLCGECWVYGSPGLYHMTFPRGRPVGAHRFVYELASGKKIAGMQAVGRTCGEPACVNPAHMYLHVYGKIVDGSLAPTLIKGLAPEKKFSEISK